MNIIPRAYNKPIPRPFTRREKIHLPLMGLLAVLATTLFILLLVKG
ncbi:MAG: hypothetical protein V1729_01210 [Candidatus Woesearchaeota archaeon]